MGDNSLLVLYVVPMEKIRRGVSLEDARKQLFAEADSLMIRDGKIPERLDGFQKSKYWREVSMRYIIANPGGFIRLYSNGVINFFINVGSEGYAHLLRWKPMSERNSIFNETGIATKVKMYFTMKSRPEIIFGISAGIYLGVTYVLVMIGMYKALYQQEKLMFVFAFVMVLFFVGSAGVVGQLRFRIPAIPYYCMFIGLAIHSFQARIKNISTDRR
jgi:hypothetical protein